MPDYNNGKIYKIIDSENKVIYIGSTTEQLCKRYSKHKHKAIGNKIILLENFPCNSREELIKKEQEFIEQYDNLLNKFRAYRSEEQQEEYMKEYRLNYWKEYYEENKNEISEKKKIFYKENKDEILEKKKIYREKNKKKQSEKDKVFYKENKNEILAKKKIFYKENKDEILEKYKVNVICECGSEIRKKSLYKHKKTKKHIKLMETK